MYLIKLSGSILEYFFTYISPLSSLFLKGWKGSRPVAAWKKVAPTLHKSTYRWIDTRAGGIGAVVLHVHLHTLAENFVLFPGLTSALS